MKNKLSLFAVPYVGWMSIFVVAPIIIMVVYAFSTAAGDFSLENFARMGTYTAVFTRSFKLAIIATLIGTIACIAINGMKRRSRAIMMGITNIPMLNAEIVTGISLMLLFLSLGIRFGFGTILLSHITFNIPYVILSIMPRMKQLNPSVYEAALDLGASRVNAFFRVVLPDLLPGILSGFLMAFTMSLDDFIITHFTKGPGIDTLSTKIYTEVKKGIKPEMYALSTLIFVTVLILLLLVNRTPKGSKNDAAPNKVS